MFGLVTVCMTVGAGVLCSGKVKNTYFGIAEMPFTQDDGVRQIAFTGYCYFATQKAA
jgi:hypothetical protein